MAPRSASVWCHGLPVLKLLLAIKLVSRGRKSSSCAECSTFK